MFQVSCFKKFVKKLFFIVAAIIVSSFFLPPRVDYFVMAEGATLAFSPDNGSFSVGKTFTVKAVVSSGGQSINAAEGVFNFYKTFLTVSKVAKDNSVFSLWAVEPTFSNSNGTVTFGGGNTAAFSGSNGTVITITFKALKAGNTELSFVSGSVLAADGKGTNIISSLSKASYSLKEAVDAPKPSPTPFLMPSPTPSPTPIPAPLPPPDITSKTHPDPEQWYSNNDPEFSWALTPDIDGTAMAITQEAESDPGPTATSTVESQTFKDIPDGVWYFHLKLHAKDGGTVVAHRKVLIDVTSPRVFTIDVRREDSTDPRPALYFDSSDETSGLKMYEIRIGDGEAVQMTLDDFRKQLPDGAADGLKILPYIMPMQGPGAHLVSVKAIDRAGNAVEEKKDITIDAIEPPKITWFPSILRQGTVLLLEGSTLPDSTVVLKIQQGEEKPAQEEIKPLGKMNWVFFRKDMAPGSYKVAAKTIDKRGAESAFSETLEFKVIPPALIERFGWIAIAVLMLAILGLLGFVWFKKRSTLRLKADAKKEIGEMRDNVRNVFDALTEEVEEKIKILNDKPSLGTADHVLEVLRGDLETSQELICKEIQDVEKTVR